MTHTFVARAPGKLFLLGEYAVLDGAPAIVAAVDRFVEVRLRIERGRSGIRIAAPGHCEAVELTPGGEATPELRFALAAVEEATLRLPALKDLRLDLEISSDLEAGAGEERKLGLGGSAAVTSAIVAAMFAAAGRDVDESRDEIFATAFSAHRNAQSGVGSGADVAASVYGGMLKFETRAESLPLVRKLDVVAGTELLVAWSGSSAATAPLVKRYLEIGAGLGRAAGVAPVRAAFVRESSTSVDAFVRGVEAGRIDTDAINANGEALEQLAAAANLPLLTPSLTRIVDLARTAGAGAKLSGAGGGDCAIALTDDTRIRDRVLSAWRDAGITVLDLSLQSGGVSVAKD